MDQVHPPDCIWVSPAPASQRGGHGADEQSLSTMQGLIQGLSDPTTANSLDGEVCGKVELDSGYLEGDVKPVGLQATI